MLPDVSIAAAPFSEEIVDALALEPEAAPVLVAVANPVWMAVSDEDPVVVRLAELAVAGAVPKVVVLP
jgi:hypothetical protein